MGAAFRLLWLPIRSLNCRSFWGGHRCQFAAPRAMRTRACNAQRERGTWSAGRGTGNAGRAPRGVRASPLSATRL
jgi:hypothetical protein